MEMYQHDSPRMFRFVLRGSLEGRWVRELECAWITARSILKGKAAVVDTSGLTGVDEDGIQLLSRMAESGVRLSAAAPPESPSLARLLGVPVAQARRRHGFPPGRWRFLSCLRAAFGGSRCGQATS